MAVSDVRPDLDLHRGRVLPSTWTDNVPAMLGYRITTFCEGCVMVTRKTTPGTFGKPAIRRPVDRPTWTTWTWTAPDRNTIITVYDGKGD